MSLRRFVEILLSAIKLNMLMNEHLNGLSCRNGTLMSRSNGCEGQTAESYHGGCAETENAIDDCWRRDPKWAENRESLADCALGFGSGAQGGKGGRIYVVTNSSDDPQFPTNGTLRYGVVQLEPLWIIFERDMKITLQQDLIFANSHKTVDGRGAKVEITGGGGLLLDSVSNIIIHSISIHDIVYSKQSNQRVRVTPNATRGRGSSGEDGIRVINQASNMWIDHCYLARCNDGALDVTKASTNVTISNNVFENHDKVHTQRFSFSCRKHDRNALSNHEAH